MNKQIERYNKDVIYFDLYFDEDKLYAKVDSSPNEDPIKYKDLKKINETNDIVFFLSNAGFKTYFEKKNEAKFKPFGDLVVSSEGQKIVEKVGYVPIK